MKMTRREIIKKGIAASIVIAVPSIIKQVIEKYNYDISDQLFPILNKSLNPGPDLIVLNKYSMNCWDLFAFYYDVKNEGGPFMNTIELNIIQPEYNDELIDSVSEYCKLNNIFIVSENITSDIDFNNFCEYCKQISDSRKFNDKKHSDYIKYIAGIYARCVDYQATNNIKTDLSIHFGNVI